MPTATQYKAKPIYVTTYEGEPGETARLAQLPVASIFIPIYQRERKAHHQKIAGEFDRTGYLIPLVLAFQGEYAGIDGQQRLAALDVLGVKVATVMLIEGVETQKRASQLYLLYNRDRRGLDAYEKFTGAYAAEDPGTHEQAATLREFNLVAGKSASSSNSVPAGAVVAIHTRFGNDVLARVLMVRELSWGASNERESREAKTLLGLATFMRSYFDAVDDNVLVDVLRKQHPASLLSKVNGHEGGSFETRYSDYVRDLYNKRFPRGKKRL